MSTGLHVSKDLVLPLEQVGRNVTIYVPERIKEKMEKLPEANWSSICQQAIFAVYCSEEG